MPGKTSAARKAVSLPLSGNIPYLQGFLGMFCGVSILSIFSSFLTVPASGTCFNAIFIIGFTPAPSPPREFYKNNMVISMFLLRWGIALFCAFASSGRFGLSFLRFCWQRNGLTCPFCAFAGSGAMPVLPACRVFTCHLSKFSNGTYLFPSPYVLFNQNPSTARIFFPRLTCFSSINPLWHVFFCFLLRAFQPKSFYGTYLFASPYVLFSQKSPVARIFLLLLTCFSTKNPLWHVYIKKDYVPSLQKHPLARNPC